MSEWVHDKLCPTQKPSKLRMPCRCSEIKEIRADEREVILGASPILVIHAEGALFTDEALDKIRDAVRSAVKQ